MKPMCAGKVRYPYRGAAIHAAVRYSRLGPQRAYPCPACHGWHLTSSRAITVPTRKADA